MHANSAAVDAAHKWSNARKNASQNVEQSRSPPKQSRKPPGTLSSLKKYMQTEAQWKFMQKVLEHNRNACKECCNAVEMHADSAGTQHSV